MKFYDAIQRANDAGRLGLIIYTIPCYPSKAIYNQIIEIIDSMPEISILETTIPVETDFSEHANVTIQDAHQLAAKEYDRETNIQQLLNMDKPILSVLYEASVNSAGFENVLIQYQSAFDGLILEWDEPNGQPYTDTSNQHGMELVECIGPWMTDQKMNDILSRTNDKGMVYLMSAEMTGAGLFPNEELEICIKKIRRIKNDVKIAAGFGISTPEHIRTLKKVSGLDAVIIGTAFLKTAHDVKLCKAYLEELGGEL